MDQEEDPKADWVCHICGKSNKWNYTACMNPPCTRGWAKKHPSTHESTCEKCGRKTILPLIQVNRTRGVLAIWGTRSVNLFHIRREFRQGLKEGMFICETCSKPDMAKPVEYGPRVCIYCRVPLRMSNPNPWCEECHVAENASRECRTCGEKLGRLEYLHCARCGPGQKYPTYYKPMFGGGMLNTNRPMKPGPGGIKSRNRAGMSLIEVKEDISREIQRHKDRQRCFRKTEADLEAQISQKLALAERFGGVEAVVQENEVGKLRERLSLLRTKLDRVGEDLQSLHEAMSSVREVHTWRMVVPGQFGRPKPKDEIHYASKFYPLANVSDEDLDAVRLDPIRMKPKPRFVPEQDLDIRRKNAGVRPRQVLPPKANPNKGS